MCRAMIAVLIALGATACTQRVEYRLDLNMDPDAAIVIGPGVAAAPSAAERQVWVDARPELEESARDAILSGEVRPGLTFEQVVAIWGDDGIWTEELIVDGDAPVRATVLWNFPDGKVRVEFIDSVARRVL